MACSTANKQSCISNRLRTWSFWHPANLWFMLLLYLSAEGTLRFCYYSNKENYFSKWMPACFSKTLAEPPSRLCSRKEKSRMMVFCILLRYTIRKTPLSFPNLIFWKKKNVFDRWERFSTIPKSPPLQSYTCAEWIKLKTRKGVGKRRKLRTSWKEMWKMSCSTEDSLASTWPSATNQRFSVSLKTGRIFQKNEFQKKCGHVTMCLVTCPIWWMRSTIPFGQSARTWTIQTTNATVSLFTEKESISLLPLLEKWANPTNSSPLGLFSPFSSSFLLTTHDFPTTITHPAFLLTFSISSLPLSLSWCFVSPVQNPYEIIPRRPPFSILRARFFTFCLFSSTEYRLLLQTDISFSNKTWAMCIPSYLLSVQIRCTAEFLCESGEKV